MDSAEFDEIEYKNVLPALTSYKDYDQSEKDDEGYDDDEYDRDQNAFRSNKGRMLYCRKCEGHGIQILLKGHTALCPYVNCQCKSCDRLMRMRKSAFIRRYRTSLKDSDGTKLTITPVRLFENTNTRFAIARDDTSDSFNTGVTSFSSYNAQLASATSQVANNFSALSLGSMTDFTPELDNQKCSTSRRDTVRPLNLSVTRENSMAPTLGGTVAGPILNQRDGILGQSHHQQISPVVASNNFTPKMMSEISPPQRELFNMIQSQNVNQSGLEAFHHQQQQLAQLHAFQQQHQQRMGLPQPVQPPQNRVIQNGNISPPRAPLALSMAPPQQMRPKRPGQPEAFQPNEPLNKRSTPGFLPNLTPQMQQQLSAMNNPQQQMALLQQVQQQQQQLQQQQQQHQQSLPTSAAMQLSALQGHLPPPSRLPFSGGPGFLQQPSYNPPNSVISTNETLQNHLRALQAPGMAGPPRPTFSEPPGDLANLMAFMASNQNQNRLLEELKRTTGFDQHQFLNQLLRQEQLLQAQQKNQQQQQQQQQNLMQMAIAQQQQHQQQQQQQQQQNNQRRQSLPAPIPNSVGMLAQNAAAASQASGIPFPNVCNTMPSPSKEVSSTSSSAPSANNSSPHQPAPTNGQTSPQAKPGPAECRYQLFLHSIDLFNRGVVDDKNALTDRFDIPEKVAEAAILTHRAQIPMPTPTLSLDHPALRNYQQGLPTSSSAPIIDAEENVKTPEQ